MKEWNHRSLKEFNRALGSDQPTPGGGAAAGAVSSISAALLLMVVNLSGEKPELNRLEEKLTECLERSYELMDADCEGFEGVIEAWRLPADNGSAQNKKRLQVEKAFKKASLPPAELMELSLEVLKIAHIVARKGNENAWTETGIAGLLAHAAVRASYYNTLINACNIDDGEFNEKKVSRAKSCLEEAESKAADLEEYLHEEIISCEYL